MSVVITTISLFGRRDCDFGVDGAADDNDYDDNCYTWSTATSQFNGSFCFRMHCGVLYHVLQMYASMYLVHSDIFCFVWFVRTVTHIWMCEVNFMFDDSVQVRRETIMMRNKKTCICTERISQRIIYCVIISMLMLYALF